MLKSLRIKNIALISQLELELESGLTVLSGETGAGKSIIIDSLNLLLGAKTDRTLIRSGENTAYAEGFFVVGREVAERLMELGIEAEGGEVLISRNINLDGRSECRINGSLVTLAMLKSISALMVDILGQHEHQSLLRPANHIHILDSFGGAEIISTRGQVSQLYAEYRQVLRELNSYGSDDNERARMIDVLSYQIEEIEGAQLKAGEEEELVRQRTKFVNMERILDAVSTAISAAESSSALASEAEASLNTAVKYDSEMSDLSVRLSSVRIEMDDIAETLKEYIDNNEFDRNAADKLERRLELIRTVVRKYGGSVPSALEFCDKANIELERLTKSGDAVAKLYTRRDKIYGDLIAAAEKLSGLRRKVAHVFEEKVMNELTDLSMGGSIFEVHFERVDKLNVTAQGLDTVEFYLSANKGNPPKPLAKVISGGEMSRFMLALKSITAMIDGIETLIFDEIDTGISGKVGQVVARKLANVGAHRQVITITHLSSIAAMADNAYYIYKETTDNSTYTRLKKCSEEEVVQEIARLSGGEGVSDLSLKNAEQIRSWSLMFKTGKVS